MGAVAFAAFAISGQTGIDKGGPNAATPNGNCCYTMATAIFGSSSEQLRHALRFVASRNLRLDIRRYHIGNAARRNAVESLCEAGFSPTAVDSSAHWGSSKRGVMPNRSRPVYLSTKDERAKKQARGSFLVPLYVSLQKPFEHFLLQPSHQRECLDEVHDRGVVFED
jgi:hypothetical protein